MQNGPNPNRIISVYRSRVDECNRLWFVDTGQLEYPNNTIRVQQTSIWMVNLEMDQVIRRFEIPSNIVTDGHGIASITPDVVSGQCDDAYAYLPDLVNYQLHVYSLRQNRIWSFNHNHFSFDPIRGDFDVAGVQYQWNDGIFSITLGNREWDGYRRAYFHAMASVSEFAVSTRILQNETMSMRSNHGKDFKASARINLASFTRYRQIEIDTWSVCIVQSIFFNIFIFSSWDIEVISANLQCMRTIIERVSYFSHKSQQTRLHAGIQRYR